MSYIEFQKDNDEYYVVPLSGHIIEIDFPSTLKDWKPEILKKLIGSAIEKKIKNKRASESLIYTANDSQRIIVATDYDREGELIGVEALEIIKGKNRSLKGEILRAKFSALTGTEIKDAFSEPIQVDYNLSDSAAAREEIDLLWGAVLTRYFSIITGRMGKDFLSIGRVQTPTLAIIVKRELEIETFVPRPYWVISVEFFKEIPFRGTLEEGPIFEEDRANKILESIQGKNGIVISFEKKDERIARPPPFSTTDFLREASRIGVQPGKAMKIAENLYVKGYISYPRTDNTVYQRSIPLKAIAEKFLESDFKKEAQLVLSQEKIRPTRGRTETTDHPPIYPV
ncbi:DNA topoisomerase III beta, partial [mine drainage metagenome]